MKSSLYNYDVFPIVFRVGKKTQITVKPQGRHADFPENVNVEIRCMGKGDPGEPFTKNNVTQLTVQRNDDGCIRFDITADIECEYDFNLYNAKTNNHIMHANIYAVNSDLAERIPLRGDFHMHTCRSDGSEDPATVIANYRKIGYDFATITDHNRYYPSLEAINTYKNVNIPINILPGEEVHIFGTYVHIVNAGGLFSVNGLFTHTYNYSDTNGADDARRFDSDSPLPAIVSDKDYESELDAIEKTITDVPEDFDKRSYAACVWIFNKIREADGLGVFAHPYWISNVWQVSESLTSYLMKNHPFDAFEVLGGENYYEQNGFQTALYYDEYRNGRIHPIVGSTDTHGSTKNNRNSDICSTIVFAKENSRKEIINAVKDYYSVAVDTISKEYRLVGGFRLQKYAAFLMENWYPIHDRLAQYDGELMRQYYVGEATAEELAVASEKSVKQFKKYFAQ